MNVTILNMGIGNIKSVQKAFEHQGATVHITQEVKDIEEATCLVLPGQGAFGEAVRFLKAHKLWDVLIKKINSGIPFLGICVGFQLLYEQSDEHEGYKGLGILKGQIKKFQSEFLKVPQIGWNQLHFKKGQSPMFQGIDPDSYVYFVHSFYADSQDAVASTTDYSVPYVSSIQKGSIWGTQFHPEKSGDIGLALIKNFLSVKQTP